MDVDLVFEGGGVLGIGYVGAVKALKEKGYRMHRCAGTSAGSVIASLLIAGYSPEELYDIIQKTDFKKFMKKTSKGKIFLIGELLSLICDKGLYDSAAIEEWVNELLEKKGKTKFKHVMEYGKSKLKIIAADITSRKMLILPEDLKQYGINPLEFSIAKAVRMSCAIPLFFTPIEIKQDKKVNFIVDGGLLSNYPIWIFDMDGVPERKTLGIKIKNPGSFTGRGKRDFISYITDIIHAPIDVDEENFIRDKDFIRTIIIDHDADILSTDFDKVNEHVKRLYMKGYESTLKFLNSYPSNHNRVNIVYSTNKKAT